MRFLLWACGVAAMLGMAGSGLSQPATMGGFVAHLLAGLASLLVFGWLAETLSAIRRAADALEDISEPPESDTPSHAHRSGADVLLGRKK